MRLKQINIDYVPLQDRLIMSIATTEAAELRLAMTRRYVKLLWPVLVQVVEESSPRIQSQANPEARRALLGLEHEQAIARADFSKPFERDARNMPLGEAPLLLAKIQSGRDPEQRVVLGLHPAEGQGVTLTADAVLLHSLCRLLQAAVKKSDWDMELKLPGTGVEEVEEPESRTIN